MTSIHNNRGAMQLNWEQSRYLLCHVYNSIWIISDLISAGNEMSALCVRHLRWSWETKYAVFVVQEMLGNLNWEHNLDVHQHSWVHLSLFFLMGNKLDLIWDNKTKVCQHWESKLIFKKQKQHAEDKENVIDSSM